MRISSTCYLVCLLFSTSASFAYNSLWPPLALVFIYYSTKETYIAIEKHNAGNLEALLELGADPNDGGFSSNVLWAAVLSGQYHATRMLLEKGADVNGETLWARQTALHVFVSTSPWEAYEHGISFAEMLLSYGADIEGESSIGWQVLHVLAQEAGQSVTWGMEQFILFLVGHGAKIDAQDSFARMPEDIAKEKGNPELVSLLRCISMIYKNPMDENTSIDGFPAIAAGVKAEELRKRSESEM